MEMLNYFSTVYPSVILKIIQKKITIEFSDLPYSEKASQRKVL